MVDPDMQSVVIDNGSGSMKIGFGGDDGPRSIFPTVISRRWDRKTGLFGDSSEVYVGEDALSRHKNKTHKKSNPIKRGTINNWNDMERIWHHSFYNEIRITPEEHPTLLTEPALTSKNNREKMMSIMFETFNVPALYIGIQSVLSIYAAGKTTGVVLQSGDGLTCVVPVFEGYAILSPVERMEVAGQDISDCILKSLVENSGKESISSFNEVTIAKDIKKKVCYISQNYEKEMKESHSTICENVYELPDGKKIDLKKTVLFQAPEILFRPTLVQSESPGIDELVFRSVRKCDCDYRREMFKNIIVSGGSTLFKGFVHRLEDQIVELCPRNTRVKVIARPERKYSAWIGGSVLSSLSSFQNLWVTDDNYDSHGTTIVHRKCF